MSPSASGSAEASSRPVLSQPAVVILPGLWYLNAIYESFRQQLESEGHEAICVQYPSTGAEPPNKTMVHDVSAARLVLETLVAAGREVIVLCHSYGGLVGQNVVYGLGARERVSDGQQGGVIAFIYLAAFVGSKYAKFSSCVSRFPAPWLKIDGPYVTCTSPKEIFFNDVEAADEYSTKLTHACVGVFDGTILFEPWHQIPCVYIACSNDAGMPYDAQKRMAEHITSNLTFLDLPAGHSPFLSMPVKVIDIIRQQSLKNKFS